jgi:hypothetical protein
MICCLALGLIKSNFDRRDLFETAANLLKFRHGTLSEWEILAEALFFCAAERKKNHELASYLREQVRSQYQQEQNTLVCFMPVFFTFEELIPLIVSGKVNYIDLMLSEDEKRRLVEHMLACNKLPDTLIKYLSDDHFQNIFKGTGWSDMGYVGFMLPVMKKHKDLFLSKLVKVAGNVEEKIAKEQLDLFIETWSICYQIDQEDCPDLSLLTRVTLIDKKSFRDGFRFLVIPRDFPSIVFKLLMGHVRFFKSQIKNEGPLLKHFRQFQDN